MSGYANGQYENELEAVTAHADDAAASRTYRDEAIRDAHVAGYSLREIAGAAGLSHGGVKKIIDRGSPDV